MKCLYPPCHSDACNERGLCRSHYNEASRFVTYSEFSWEHLEKAGRVNPVIVNRDKQPKNRRPHEFATWLKQG